MHLKEDVEKLLAELGHTPSEVAATIEACKLRGVRNTVRTLNPVVRYLQLRIKNEAVEFDLRAMISDNTIRIKRAESEHKDVIAIPEPVLQFLVDFNAGKHPQLEFDDDTPVPTRKGKLAGESG